MVKRSLFFLNCNIYTVIRYSLLYNKTKVHMYAFVCILCSTRQKSLTWKEMKTHETLNGYTDLLRKNHYPHIKDLTERNVCSPLSISVFISVLSYIACLPFNQKLLDTKGQEKKAVWRNKGIIWCRLSYDTDVQVIRQGIQNVYDSYIKCSDGKISNIKD